MTMNCKFSPRKLDGKRLARYFINNKNSAWLSFQSIHTVDARRAREPSIPFQTLRAAIALVAPGPLGALLALVPLGAQISWGARVAVQGVRALVMV